MKWERLKVKYNFVLIYFNFDWGNKKYSFIREILIIASL